MFCSCPFCGRNCSHQVRPYVCTCGSVFGKHGWQKKLTVNRSNSSDLRHYATENRADHRRHWAKLHLMHHATPEEFSEWRKAIPSECECSGKTEDILKKIPPRHDDPDSWFRFTVDFHNAINASLKHETVSLARAEMLWRNKRLDTGRSRAVITVASGPAYAELLLITRPLIKKYADRVDADFIDLDNDTEIWGPMEKFRVWHFANQYDEILYVDADTLITDSCPDLFSMFSGDVVIHDDYPMFHHKTLLDDARKMVARRSETSIPARETALNTGVVLTRKAARDIWKRPSVDIGTSRFAEQVWIENQILQQHKVTKLPSKANWQYWFGKNGSDGDLFEDHARDAWILHAASSQNKETVLLNAQRHVSIPSKQKAIDSLVAVTSLSLLPHHAQVQRKCLQTWRNLGLEIVSGNAAEEIDHLRNLYPYVKFVECRSSTLYDRPTPKIYDLLQLSKKPFLLVNSDIEIYGNQDLLVKAVEGRECLVLLRHNYESSIFEPMPEHWGIDGFLLFPEIAASFPDLDFAIGQPMWDYWVPFHLEIIEARTRWIGEPFLFHKKHAVHWSNNSLVAGQKMIGEHYRRWPVWESWRRERPYSDGAPA